MENNKSYYAIFTPSSVGEHSSLCYTARGYLSDTSVGKLIKQLDGSLCSVRAFKSEQDFLSHLQEVDERLLLG